MKNIFNELPAILITKLSEICSEEKNRSTEIYNNTNIVDKYEKHALTVFNIARVIALRENVSKRDMCILDVVSILHVVGAFVDGDYGYGKEYSQQAYGPEIVRKILEEMDVPEDIVDDVCKLLKVHLNYDEIISPIHQIFIEADFLADMEEITMEGRHVEEFLAKVCKTETTKEIFKRKYGLTALFSGVQDENRTFENVGKSKLWDFYRENKKYFMRPNREKLYNTGRTIIADEECDTSKLFNNDNEVYSFRKTEEFQNIVKYLENKGMVIYRQDAMQQSCFCRLMNTMAIAEKYYLKENKDWHYHHYSRYKNTKFCKIYWDLFDKSSLKYSKDVLEKSSFLRSDGFMGFSDLEFDPSTHEHNIYYEEYIKRYGVHKYVNKKNQRPPSIRRATGSSNYGSYTGMRQLGYNSMKLTGTYDQNLFKKSFEYGAGVNQFRTEKKVKDWQDALEKSYEEDRKAEEEYYNSPDNPYGFYYYNPELSPYDRSYYYPYEDEN